ncbi:caspase family protein [Methylobacter sp. BBA5.1]|uniref:caspase family protein n=1 Tax=Methylobacter sp. BBA5.1 TaxID=1495064 RepID=UPI000A833197|nr:caspase family protein [Methylobacter sp. BBA5.1]
MIFTRKTPPSAVCFLRTATPKYFFLSLFFTLLIGCQVDPPVIDLNHSKVIGPPPPDIHTLFVVDCLLPAYVRRLGTQVTDALSRRPVKTTAGECENHGGEYVAYDRADVESALKVWEAQAQSGDAEAQAILGEIYEKGLGGTADPALAAQWYLKAAKQGNSRAQVNLGHLYEQGLGVRKSLRTALKWYRQASGLANSGLRYASVTEATVSDTPKKQRRHKIGNGASDSGHLQQMAQSRQKLEQMQARLKALESEYHDTFARIKKDMSGIESKAPQTDKLKQDKAELLVQAQQIKELKESIEQERRTLASLENAPLIDISDPSLTLISGEPGYQLKTDVRSKKVAGKIAAVGNLKTLRINNQVIPVGDDGSFLSRIALASALTPVRIETTDKQGKRYFRTFNLLAKNQDMAADEPALPVKTRSESYPSVDFGQFYALIIGNNDYEQLPALATSVNDAKAVDDMLRTRYGYKTTLLINANRRRIMAAFDELSQTLTKKDNLLIYYAGHGKIDVNDQSAYWLPADAETGNSATWLSSHHISQYLGAFPARHILVVADSCYSDLMSKRSIVRLPEGMSEKRREKWMEFMNNRKARTIITSGGDKPVPDADSGHSVFANAFLKTLEANNGLLKDYELFRFVSGIVKQAGPQADQQQSPHYSALQYAGHESSPFFFVPEG